MYADPGSGLMLLQIITATLSAAIFRFRKLLRPRFLKPREVSASAQARIKSTITSSKTSLDEM